jgi:hypothetical protein
MKKLLLASAGGLALSGGANANGWPSHLQNVQDYYAAALAVNVGEVGGNRSTTSAGQDNSATLRGSFGGFRGVANVNQNAGANSGLQNSVAVSYVEGCDCSVTSPIIFGLPRGDANANSVAANVGQVVGNTSENVSPLLIVPGTTATATLDNAFNGSTGLVQVNQNAGANSLMQNSSALASITYCNCAIEDLSTTIAAAGNLGSVTGNHASASLGSAGVTMTNAFNGTTGVTQVSQNAGANSMMQNAVAIGAIYQRTN